MCVVSGVIHPLTTPSSPDYLGVWPWPNMEPSTATQLLKVIELLEKIDKKLDNKECKVEANKKAKFKKQLKKVAARSKKKNTPKKRK